VPEAKPGGRPEAYPKREILNGIFYLLRSGCSWRMLPKHGHDRLCWLIQKRSEKRACIRHSKARETEAMPLVTRTPMALEMDGCALTNRVTTPFTLVGNSADSPAPPLRPSPATGHAAEILDVEDPYLGYDAEKFPYKPPQWQMRSTSRAGLLGR
jgi:hypothetical protein